jgi:hypothetical protein
MQPTKSARHTSHSSADSVKNCQEMFAFEMLHISNSAKTQNQVTMLSVLQFC